MSTTSRDTTAARPDDAVQGIRGVAVPARDHVLTEDVLRVREVLRLLPWLLVLPAGFVLLLGAGGWIGLSAKRASVGAIAPFAAMALAGGTGMLACGWLLLGSATGPGDRILRRRFAAGAGIRADRLCNPGDPGTHFVELLAWPAWYAPQDAASMNWAWFKADREARCLVVEGDKSRHWIPFRAIASVDVALVGGQDAKGSEILRTVGSLPAVGPVAGRMLRLAHREEVILLRWNLDGEGGCLAFAPKDGWRTGSRRHLRSLSATAAALARETGTGEVGTRLFPVED